MWALLTALVAGFVKGLLSGVLALWAPIGAWLTKRKDREEGRAQGRAEGLQQATSEAVAEEYRKIDERPVETDRDRLLRDLNRMNVALLAVLLFAGCVTATPPPPVAALPFPQRPALVWYAERGGDGACLSPADADRLLRWRDKLDVFGTSYERLLGQLRDAR